MLTLEFRYEMLLLQPGSAPGDVENHTTTDTLVISKL
jgi:hypothetical protein